MSKLFYRLKHNGLLYDSYKPFILKTDKDSVIIEEYKRITQFFDEINTDMFKEAYISYIHVYEQELIDAKKRKIAKYAKTKLLQKYHCINGDNCKPTDQYIYIYVYKHKDLPN